MFNSSLKFCFPPLEIDDNHQLMENLPYSVHEDLASKLNPEGSNNWRRLAAHLNFTNERVRNIALQPQFATQELLNEWMIYPNSTAYILHDILVNYMGRPDAAAIIHPFLFKQAFSTV